MVVVNIRLRPSERAQSPIGRLVERRAEQIRAGRSSSQTQCREFLEDFLQIAVLRRRTHLNPHVRM